MFSMYCAKPVRLARAIYKPPLMMMANIGPVGALIMRSSIVVFVLLVKILRILVNINFEAKARNKKVAKIPAEIPQGSN
jgi:hypothetical protein